MIHDSGDYVRKCPGCSVYADDMEALLAFRKMELGDMQSRHRMFVRIIKLIFVVGSAWLITSLMRGALA